MGDDDVSNTQRPKSAGALVVQDSSKVLGVLSKVLKEKPNLPADVRKVRRGKFFLSNIDQATHGSLRRPILDHLCHGAEVGQMEFDEKGMWCFGAHNDFELIPEFQNIWDWPEYVRTTTGWILKKEGMEHNWTEHLLTGIANQKRLV